MHWIGRRSISFNPRSREGSDCLYFYCFVVKVGFQSTLPRRERHMFSFLVWDFERFNPRSREGSDDLSGRYGSSSKRSFNPRSREGSDQRVCGCCRTHLVSIHAPAKGATIFLRLVYYQKVVSIHAPAKGATKMKSRKWKTLLFQSTLPRRERRRASGSRAADLLFQSTLPRRERRMSLETSSQRQLVSIHAPAKGAT